MKGPELDYVVKVLEERIETLKILGPAQDNAERALRRVRALERAIELLRKPRFDINPFV